MLKMPSFDMNTRPQTLVPLVRCVIKSVTLCLKPCQTFVRRCFSSSMSWTWWVTQMHVLACIHVKGGHVSFNVTQEYTNN